MTLTIEIPASEPVDMARPEGDAGGAEAFATTVYTTAARFEEFGDHAGRLTTAAGRWSGAAFNAYLASAGSASKEHATLAGALRRVGHAASAYADTLADLIRDYDGLVETKRGLDSERSSLIADVRATEAAEPHVVEALRSRAGSLRQSYRWLVQDYQALVRAVADNEGLLARALARTDILAESFESAAGVDPLAAAVMKKPGAPGPGSTPAQVNEWWSGLSEAEREALIASYPSLIGCTDGLPAGARDQANRISLEDDLARLSAKEADGTISPSERTALENARATQRGLRDIEGYVDPTTGERPGGQLYLYDPFAFDGDGKVAIAIGDLDTAEDVAVRVPGITNDMSKSQGLSQEAVNLYQSTRYNGDGSSVASMFWLGYDAPDGFHDPATFTEGRAEEGGGQFADAIEGLRASRPGDPAHLTAIGHSYGSTTVAHAATDHGIDVDEIALVGSPGAGGGVEKAAELGVGSEHVWVGRNSQDPVAALADQGFIGGRTIFGAGLGNDPSEDDFGANRFQAEDVGRSEIFRKVPDQHSQYFRPDSESLYNLGRIVDGDPDAVNHAEHTYDPWYRGPQDPEEHRTPTGDVGGKSDTGPDLPWGGG